ncbi:nascent polypeptide-associated complex subunit alpha, muscle-specific form-like [Haemorhous mexicanus]|uniref:nascent polypeptide-associated complex subunit alpha, muscle-specific form-like n=1 Tax=Haemorhous mexicanus TaxID=30427 RepID=UPI0028BDF0C4|nr:nascent polypeptide-associated complex subunit alpha, muscle-specific form-like [Haemorhous mexicanus]
MAPLEVRLHVRELTCTSRAVLAAPDRIPEQATESEPGPAAATPTDRDGPDWPSLQHSPSQNASLSHTHSCTSTPSWPSLCARKSLLPHPSSLPSLPGGPCTPPAGLRTPLGARMGGTETSRHPRRGTTPCAGHSPTPGPDARRGTCPPAARSGDGAGAHASSGITVEHHPPRPRHCPLPRRRGRSLPRIAPPSTGPAAPGHLARPLLASARPWGWRCGKHRRYQAAAHHNPRHRSQRAPGKGSGRSPAHRQVPGRVASAGIPAALPRHSPLPTAAPAPLCARRAPAPPSPAAGRPAPPPRRAGGGGGRSRDPRRRPLPPAGHMQREGAAQAPGGSPGARPAASEASSGVKMATSAAGEGIPRPARSAPRCRLGWARRGGEGLKSGCRCPSALSLCRPLLLRRLRQRRSAPCPPRCAPLPSPGARYPPQRDPSADPSLAKMCWHGHGLKE